MDAIASKNSSKSLRSFEPLCQADFDSMPSTCDEDGHRKVDKFGLAVIFTGILLTGIGNSAFYTFGVAYLGRDHLSSFCRTGGPAKLLSTNQRSPDQLTKLHLHCKTQQGRTRCVEEIL